MSVTSFIGQCFHNGIWGMCSRKNHVNKYVEKAATRKWKYRDGKNDDEADGVVDVGDLAELEYSIVDQQPNAIVLKIDDLEPQRQESVEATELQAETVSAHLLNGEDFEEEEIVTTPTVMNKIEHKITKRSSSLSSDQLLVTSQSVSENENKVPESDHEDERRDSVFESEDHASSENSEQIDNEVEAKETIEQPLIQNGQHSSKVENDVNDNIVENGELHDSGIRDGLQKIEELKQENSNVVVQENGDVEKTELSSLTNTEEGNSCSQNDSDLDEEIALR